MPIASHTKAANDHKSAAAAHENVAALHTKGDHTAALDGSSKAKGHSDIAGKSAMDAHEKSVISAKK